MASYTVQFSTQDFQADIKEFKLYQDPVNPDTKRAVATVSFNFPVDPKSLEQNTALVFQTVQQGKLTGNDPLHFTYTFDKNKRTAYLNSDPVTIKNTPPIPAAHFKQKNSIRIR
jgi:hypothetical protein